MSQKDITSLRGTIELLKEQQEILIVNDEVDPIYEISGIQKALEGGPALLFENIKGYPGVRDIGNIFATEKRMSQLFDVDDHRKLKFKCVEAMRNPIPPEIVEGGPCQEVVIAQDIDVKAILPLIMHTERDGGRLLGGGNTLLSGKYFRHGTHLSFNRMNFRGKDWAAAGIMLGTHLGNMVLVEHRGERIPVTINIGTPPAVMMVAGAELLHPLVPPSSDELGFAGGLQGSPVEICKAKTVDAYAIANSEWVIEGYIEPERVWETDEAEKTGRIDVEPVFPEWPGYLGRAYRVPKFQATAITHRADKPIFFTPLARSLEVDILSAAFREACLYQLADSLYPAFVVDVNILKGVAGWGANMIFQVRKTRAQEGYQRALLEAVCGVVTQARLVVVVDEDVDIYSPEDILWAMTTRVDPQKDIIIGHGGLGQALMPGIELGMSKEPSKESPFRRGTIALDATVAVALRWRWERAHYPVDRIELRKWFSEEEIAVAQAMQSDYARLLAQTGR
jgi:4-hydroxy-3-polyprenylbenzoate decarboxylase